MHARWHGLGVLLHILTFSCQFSQLIPCLCSMGTLPHVVYIPSPA